MSLDEVIRTRKYFSPTLKMGGGATLEQKGLIRKTLIQFLKKFPYFFWGGGDFKG